MTGHSSRQAVADIGIRVGEIVKVESTHDGVVVIDQDEERAEPRGLIS